jgi:hypothetical protein
MATFTLRSLYLGVIAPSEPGSSVSIVTGYGLGDRGSIPDGGRGFFLYPLRPSRLWGPPSLLYNGCRRFFPGGRARPGRDADHSPPSSGEVKREYELHLLSPPSAPMACSGTSLLVYFFIYCTGRQVSLRSGLNVETKKKSLPLSEIDPRLSCR